MRHDEIHTRGSDRRLTDRTSPPNLRRAAEHWWAILRAAVILGFQPTLRNALHWLSWIVALGLELALVVLLRSGDIYGWEQDVTRALQRIPARQPMFEVANFLTNTLSTPFLVLFAVIVAAVFAFGHRLDAVLLLLTFPLHVLAQFPKALVDRPRPSSEFPSIEGIGGFQSFPSGHTEYVISFYGFLVFILTQGLDRRWQRALAATACVGFVLTVGMGRVALGRHWPLDVIASYIVGAGILSGILWLRWSIRRAILDMDAEHPQRDSERENVSGDVDGR